MPDLVIFDCDGVLVDTEIVAARVEAKLLSQAGHAITAEELAERYAGMTFEAILREVEAESGLPLQASLIDAAEKMVDERLAREARAVEGAHAALAGAPAPACICSNSSTPRLRLTLGRAGLLDLAGDRIYSAMDTEDVAPKPAPDVFLHAARRHGAAPANCFVIEDSVYGVAGAKAAGMRVIGFTGASHSYPGHADALIESGAETVVARLSQVRPTIEALEAFGALD